MRTSVQSPGESTGDDWRCVKFFRRERRLGMGTGGGGGGVRGGRPRRHHRKLAASAANHSFPGQFVGSHGEHYVYGLPCDYERP